MNNEPEKYEDEEEDVTYHLTPLGCIYACLLTSGLDGELADEIANDVLRTLKRSGYLIIELPDKN